MKTKLSKGALVLLTAGVFVIALIVLVVNYRGQLDEQARLNQQIGTLQVQAAAVNELSAKETNLKTQIAEAKSQINILQRDLNQTGDEMYFDGEIFQIAEKNNVLVVEISSGGMVQEIIGKMEYDALTLTLKLEGEVSDLLQFVIDLNNKFPTGIIRSSSLRVTDVQPPQPPTEVVTISILSYKGGK